LSFIRSEEESERIPLTIADFDRKQGTIHDCQAVGNTTNLCETI
jgi:NAD(P)H-flavin reductase